MNVKIHRKSHEKKIKFMKSQLFDDCLGFIFCIKERLFLQKEMVAEKKCQGLTP